MSLRSLVSLSNCLAILLFSSVNGFAEEEIRVALMTKSQLASTYLSQFTSEGAAVSPSYLQELNEILFFDLKYSGYMSLARMDESHEKTLAQTDLVAAFSPQKWSKASISYVCKGTIKNQKLSFLVFSPKAGTIKEFESIPISGKIEVDRKAIHKLADGVLHSLFGARPIASTRILYSLQTREKVPGKHSWKSEVWECDWDGGSPHQITFENDYSITPVLIPAHPQHGGDRFLYVTYKNGQPKIYFSSVHNKTGRGLIPLRGNQLLPAISRQRDQIAFITDASGRADLFLQGIDDEGRLNGKPQQLFSYPRSTQGSPTFSPDGKQIAFVSDKDGVPRIYLISTTIENNKRPQPHLITRISKENTCPCWSPDGTKIAYSAKTSGVRQIWIYDVETKEEQQLTMGPGHKENPSWAPDSLHLVFNSTDPGISDLYIVNLNQPEAVRISKGAGINHYPTWGTR